ncbi:MAG: NADH:flavin oxidoreductase [Thermoproteota archaeon]|nr:NADH:flavin oxidoreductase [Thermoproteota archaeon]
MTRLFDTLSIKSMNLKNRLVLPPMRCGKAGSNGEVTDDLIQHYLNLSDGPGLVIIEHTYIADGGRSQGQLGISHDQHISGLSKLTNAIHSKGVPTVLQINHVGSMAVSKVIGAQPVGPSAIVNPRNADKEMPKAMTKTEIEEVVQAFVQASIRAVKAGFDGVEVHCAHGYLNSEYMSPLANIRQDEYGGSPENRIRLATESVKAIRKVVDKDYPVFCRFGARDCLPSGLELPESSVMAGLLVNAGVDVLDVSGGMGGIEPLGEKPQGFFVPEAEALRKATGATVIGVGGIIDPNFADEAISKGRVDLIAIGRGMLKDPTWCKNALATLAIKS